MVRCHFFYYSCVFDRLLTRVNLLSSKIDNGDDTPKDSVTMYPVTLCNTLEGQRPADLNYTVAKAQNLA